GEARQRKEEAMITRRCLAGLMGLLLAGVLDAAAPPPRQGGDRYGDPLPPGAVARLGTVRLRQSLTHGSTHCQLLFSLDGRELLSRGETGLRRWDLAGGRLLDWLPDENRPAAMRLLPDGKTLVTATLERTRERGRPTSQWFIERRLWGHATPRSR